MADKETLTGEEIRAVEVRVSVLEMRSVSVKRGVAILLRQTKRDLKE